MDAEASTADQSLEQKNANSEEENASEESEKTESVTPRAAYATEEAPPGIEYFSEGNPKPLDVDVVVEILKNVDNYRSVAYTDVPSDPQGGNVFLFLPDTEEEQAFFRKDQYVWVNHGPKAIPAKDPVIQKRYFVAKLGDGRPSKFHKTVYTLLNDIRPLKPFITQYLGNPDGLIESAKKSKSSDKTGAESYMTIAGKKRTSSSNSIKAAKPITMQHKKLAIDKDDAKLLHEFAYGIPGFVHCIQIAPTFMCIVGLKDLTDHLETMLQQNEKTGEPILFSYSHSFPIGNFVLSSFHFAHSAFDGKPAIPSHFVIHEKGDATVHQELFRVLQDTVPSFGSEQAAIVTEGDKHKNECIKGLGLNLKPIASWKALIASAREWMVASGAMQQEVAKGIEDLKKLLSSANLEEYEANLAEINENWATAMQKYYMENIDELARNELCRWYFEQWGTFSPDTGVHDKANVNLEIVVQHLQALVSVTANNIATACYLTQHYVRKEIRDGASGIGRLITRLDITEYQEGMSTWKPIPFLCLPENVVHYIKEDQIAVQELNLVERKGGDAKKLLFNKGKHIHEAGNVHLNTSSHAFIVRDLDRPQSFVVKLFPRATCSCDSAMFCQHIIAVKISVGIDMESEMDRLDTKFVTRALKSSENAAEGIKTRRRRKKRPNTDTNDFESASKRDCVLGQKAEPMSEGDDESENGNEDSVQPDGNHQVDFFHTGESVAFFS